MPGLAGFERNDQALAEEKARQDKEAQEFSNAPMLYLLSGTTQLRILPPYDEKGVFFKQVYKHRVKNGDDVFQGLCPEANDLGFDCAICAKGQDLYATKDEKAMEAAKQLRPRKHFLYNAICFSGPQNRRGEVPEPGKVYVMECGVMVHRQIFELDQDEAAGWADITSIDSGVNLIVKRTGSGLETKYLVNPHGKGRSDLVEWFGTIGIDPGGLELHNLDEVYAPPTEAEVNAVAAKIRVPTSAAAQPTFTPAPAAPAQAEAPAAPAQSAPIATTIAPPQPIAAPEIPAPPTPSE